MIKTSASYEILLGNWWGEALNWDIFSWFLRPPWIRIWSLVMHRAGSCQCILNHGKHWNSYSLVFISLIIEISDFLLSYPHYPFAQLVINVSLLESTFFLWTNLHYFHAARNRKSDNFSPASCPFDVGVIAILVSSCFLGRILEMVQF